MSCPSELTCSAYVDGALSREEAGDVERHADTCAACHTLIESLSAERILLRNTLQTAGANGAIPAFVPRPTISRLLVWLGWAAIAIWAVSTAWISLLSTLTLPDSLAWLSPSAIGTGVQLLTTTLLSGTSAADISAALINAAQSVVVALIALAGFGWLVRHQPGPATSPLIALSALSLLLITPALAQESSRED